MNSNQIQKCNHNKMDVIERITVKSALEIEIEKKYKCTECKQLFEVLALEEDTTSKENLLKIKFPILETK